MSDQRYTIIGDNSGHKYLCPADRADEAIAMIEAIEQYWDEGDYDKPEPPDPDFLQMIDGGRLTFASPQIAGVEVGQ